MQMKTPSTHHVYRAKKTADRMHASYIPFHSSFMWFCFLTKKKGDEEMNRESGKPDKYMLKFSLYCSSI
ncbi:MAG: hypothetical protein BACD_00415 [Bacteroides rodentium]